MGNLMLRTFSALATSGMLFFAALPSTTNYQLQSYGFGSGGTAGSSTSNYSLEGISGEISGSSASTTNYLATPGFIATEQANEPTITLSNPSNYYDKLNFVINTQNNPTDALYALEISTSSTFASGNTYLMPSDTLSATLSTSDYQTYTAWGGASGQNILGLANSKTYYMRAKATRGNKTETGWGPASSAATVGQQITYCLYTGASCGSGSSIAFNGMTGGTIASSPNNITVNFATNADSGGNVYIYSQNGSFKSPSTGASIASSTANLSAASSGYGAQVLSSTQTSGGPLTALAPYNGTANNVGVLPQTIATILSSNSPIVGGTSSIGLKILPSNTTPEATDYFDNLTLIAAASF